MIDFSHANAAKQYKRQLDVARDVGAQVADGSRCIIGAMVESHLVEGKQDLVAGKPLAFGQSITDPCLGWDDSVGAARCARRRGEGARGKKGKR